MDDYTGGGEAVFSKTYRIQWVSTDGKLTDMALSAEKNDLEEMNRFRKFCKANKLHLCNDPKLWKKRRKQWKKCGSKRINN